MLSQRQRPIVYAIAAIALIWVLAIASYTIAKNSRITPEKVRAYTQSINFNKLSGADRKAAIEKLAAMLNALSIEERESLQLDHTAYQWFEQMTEDEKGEFLEATMPTGFKQMISAFEQLPEDRQKRVIDQAMKQMKADREKMAATGSLPPRGTNEITLSDELSDKVMKIGLKTFYSQSSAQTKAELAPLLEEMQQTMQGARMMRGARR
jgi:hypothetical protein